MYFIKLNKIIKVTKKQIQDQEPLKRFHSNFHTIGICPEILFILTDCFVCTLNYSEDLYRPVQQSLGSKGYNLQNGNRRFKAPSQPSGFDCVYLSFADQP